MSCQLSPIGLDGLPVGRKCFQHSLVINAQEQLVTQLLICAYRRKDKVEEPSEIWQLYSLLYCFRDTVPLFTYFIVYQVSISAVINYHNLTGFHWARSKYQKVAFISGDSGGVCIFLLIHVVSRIEFLVIVGLIFPFSCELSFESHPQLLENSQNFW